MVTRNERTLQWFTSEQNFTDLLTTAQLNLPLYDTTRVNAQFIKNATVTRMLVDLRCRANGVAQTVFFHWGIVVVNADAVVAAVFPDPQDLSDRAGWLARGKLTTIQASLSDSSQEDKMRVDLRSQRILRNEESTLQLVVHNSSGFTLEWYAFIRVLMRMP